MTSTRLSPTRHGADRAAVPARRPARTNPGRSAIASSCAGCADLVGGGPPARAEHDGDVVARDAGGLRERGGGRGGRRTGRSRPGRSRARSLGRGPSSIPSPADGRSAAGAQPALRRWWPTASAPTSNSRADTLSELPPGSGEPHGEDAARRPARTRSQPVRCSRRRRCGRRPAARRRPGSAAGRAAGRPCRRAAAV